VLALKEGVHVGSQKPPSADMLRKLQLWAYDHSVFTQLDRPTIQETTLSVAIFGVAFITAVLPTGEKWMQKTV